MKLMTHDAGSPKTATGETEGAGRAPCVSPVAEAPRSTAPADPPGGGGAFRGRPAPRPSTGHASVPPLRVTETGRDRGGVRGGRVGCDPGEPEGCRETGRVEGAGTADDGASDGGAGFVKCVHLTPMWPAASDHVVDSGFTLHDQTSNAWHGISLLGGAPSGWRNGDLCKTRVRLKNLWVRSSAACCATQSNQGFAGHGTLGESATEFAQQLRPCNTSW